MNKKSLGILAAVLLFGGMGVFYTLFLPMTRETQILEEVATASPTVAEETPDMEGAAEAKEAALVYVHVCGQVKEPGVYALGTDSRVADAIEAAGGFTKKAWEASLNLARKVQDGEQLYVLSEDEAANEAAPSGEGAASAVGTGGLVNINSAAKEELMGLPGIGEAKAEAIISYRSQNGNFEKIEDLKKIEGIKDGVFGKIKDKITV